MKRIGLPAASVLALAIILAGCNATPAAQPTSLADTKSTPQPTEQATDQSTTAPGAGGCTATSPDQEGPYYKAGAPFVSQIAPPDLPGQRLILTGIVQGSDCKPLAGAVIEIWQADSKGQYDFSDKYILRGGQKTDANGSYTFETIMPGYYEPRPLHIHLKASHLGAQSLTTQIYFASDPRSAGMPSDLIVQTTQDGSTLKATFNIVLALK